MVINPIVGVYIPIIRIPIKGGMTISNIATFDQGTYNIIILGGGLKGFLFASLLGEMIQFEEHIFQMD